MQIFSNMLFNMFVNCLWSFGKVKEKKGENIQYMLHNTSNFSKVKVTLTLTSLKLSKDHSHPSTASCLLWYQIMGMSCMSLWYFFSQHNETWKYMPWMDRWSGHYFIIHVPIYALVSNSCNVATKYFWKMATG